METEPWDRAEDLFIRQRLKERRPPEEIALRLWSLGYRRTIDVVAERCIVLKNIGVRRPSAVSLREDDDPPIDVRTQDRDFVAAMRHAIVDGDERAIERTFRDNAPVTFTHISPELNGSICGSSAALCAALGHES